jgi:hypothetical protein
VRVILRGEGEREVEEGEKGTQKADKGTEKKCRSDYG